MKCGERSLTKLSDMTVLTLEIEVCNFREEFPDWPFDPLAVLNVYL